MFVVMEQIETLEKSIPQQMREMEILEEIRIPYKRRFYVSNVAYRLRMEENLHFVTRKEDNHVVIIRIK